MIDMIDAMLHHTTCCSHQVDNVGVAPVSFGPLFGCKIRHFSCKIANFMETNG